MWLQTFGPPIIMFQEDSDNMWLQIRSLLIAKRNSLLWVSRGSRFTLCLLQYEPNWSSVADPALMLWAFIELHGHCLGPQQGNQWSMATVCCRDSNWQLAFANQQRLRHACICGTQWLCVLSNAQTERKHAQGPATGTQCCVCTNLHTPSVSLSCFLSLSLVSVNDTVCPFTRSSYYWMRSLATVPAVGIAWCYYLSLGFLNICSFIGLMYITPLCGCSC